MTRPWIRLLPCGVASVAMLVTLAMTPPTDASGAYGGFRPSRLYRHRSGFLHGYYRHEAPSCVPRGYGYGGGFGGYGYGPSGAVYPPILPYETHGRYDPMVDFDFRRDRLLDHASQVDVSYLGGQLDPHAGRAAPTNVVRRPTAPVRARAGQHEDEVVQPRTRPIDREPSAGWVYLEKGQHTKAIGRFTARLMHDPNDGHALIGFGLTSAHLGDDASAMKAFTAAIRRDPDAVRSFTASAEIEADLRRLLPRYAALAQHRDACHDGITTTSVLLCLLGDYDTAAAVLEATEVTVDESRTMSAIRELLASVAPATGTLAVNDPPAARDR